QRKDKAGNVIEDVERRDGYLFFFDRKDHQIERALGFKRGNDDLDPSIITPGRYDADRGSFTYKTQSGSKALRYLATNREDTVATYPQFRLAGPTGNITGDGVASVSHEAGSAATLGKDNSILLRDAGCGQFRKDALTDTEKTFLKTHADSLDRRDFAEIHRR